MEEENFSILRRKKLLIFETYEVLKPHRFLSEDNTHGKKHPDHPHSIPLPY